MNGSAKSTTSPAASFAQTSIFDTHFPSATCLSRIGRYALKTPGLRLEMSATPWYPHRLRSGAYFLTQVQVGLGGLAVPICRIRAVPV